MLISNNGKEITATDYWQTPLARRGGIYVSINAGAARVLLPAELVAPMVAEARTAAKAEVSRYLGGYSVMFDDDSDTPFTIQVGPGQFDRLLPAHEVGKAIEVLVYGPGPELLLRLPGVIGRPG